MTDNPAVPLRVTDRQVRALLQDQFPAFADLPLQALPSAGTDNLIFRLGDHLCVRLPKVDWAARTPERETRILNQFGNLPLATPKAVALGRPGEGYPWSWSILTWIDGQALVDADDFDQSEVAGQLADFIAAMRRHCPDPDFTASAANHFRGVSLAERDRAIKKALEGLSGKIDTDTVRRIWQTCLDARASDRPVWLHGDLHAGNLLMQGGRLSGVIDFGLAGVGDGACDLQPAWCLFDGPARALFRDRLQPDEADWLRGIGWALSIACIALVHYDNTGSPLAAMSRKTIGRILAALG